MTVGSLSPREAGVGAFVTSLMGLIGLVVALPVVLLAGAPFGGWLLGAGLWIVNWTVQLMTGKVSLRISAPAAVGVSGISFMARAWLVAILLFVVALRFSQEAALTGAAVFLAAFTFDLAGRAILFGMQQPRVAAHTGGAQGTAPARRDLVATSGRPVSDDPPTE